MQLALCCSLPFYPEGISNYFLELMLQRAVQNLGSSGLRPSLNPLMLGVLAQSFILLQKLPSPKEAASPQITPPPRSLHILFCDMRGTNAQAPCLNLRQFRMAIPSPKIPTGSDKAFMATSIHHNFPLCPILLLPPSQWLFLRAIPNKLPSRKSQSLLPKNLS